MVKLRLIPSLPRFLLFILRTLLNNDCFDGIRYNYFGKRFFGFQIIVKTAYACMYAEDDAQGNIVFTTGLARIITVTVFTRRIRDCRANAGGGGETG